MFLLFSIINKLFLQITSLLVKCRIRESELELRVRSCDSLFLLYILKQHSLFLYNILVDICAIDLVKKQRRFVLIYNFLSPKFNQRLRFILFTDTLISVCSITSLFKAADWLEREI
jgi:NADH:ubiquinone oxidoreductase subunit C